MHGEQPIINGNNMIIDLVPICTFRFIVAQPNSISKANGLESRESIAVCSINIDNDELDILKWCDVQLLAQDHSRDFRILRLDPIYSGIPNVKALYSSTTVQL
ncbi:hypothetical protein TWF225_006061 [Orbilia oligospora]|nr:hypothetical protein TWF225_006061 [Orbilia oligospora]KAF3247793.1 hypothetical protein TWF128_008522 [Orbilia oligospora]KAF3266669.1 hypothetical protein TWF217_001454 [Orbilia oligospora]KAF3276698.1 hypothetical protein TWF132_002125 [Orbilia oligospora]